MNEGTEMITDVVTEVNGLWSELRKDLNSLDAQSPESEIEKFLNRVVVLRGVEIQTVYPGLEDLDDEADLVTAKGTHRLDKIQTAMEQLSYPINESAWQTFADALTDHLDQSPKDIGVRLEALSKEDRAELGEQTKTACETLS